MPAETTKIGKKKAVGLECIEVKKTDGSLEKTLKWKCPVCGRIWFSKGELLKKSFFSMSQIFVPPHCPCYWLEPSPPKEGIPGQ